MRDHKILHLRSECANCKKNKNVRWNHNKTLLFGRCGADPHHRQTIAMDHSRIRQRLCAKYEPVKPDWVRPARPAEKFVRTAPVEETPVPRKRKASKKGPGTAEKRTRKKEAG